MLDVRIVPAPQPQPADTGFTLDQPGPWRADSYDPMHIVADMPNGRDVVLVCRVDTNTYKDMGRRNRDLILAAPDLLEALEPFARIRLDTDDLPMDFAELVLRARAAVTKAKGGNK